MSDSNSNITPPENRLCPRCKTLKSVKEYSPKGQCCRACNNARCNAYYHSSPEISLRIRKRQKPVKNPFRLVNSIKSRCLNPEYASFYNYGARGISIYPGWIKNPQALVDYLGPRPSKSHSVDRIDNDGNYEPGNVRWATKSEQQRNKRNNRYITAFGKTMLVIEWAEFTKVKSTCIQNRLCCLGWSDRDAVGTPLGSSRGVIHSFLSESS